MKYFVISLFLTTLLQAEIVIPRSSFDAIKAGIEAKLAQTQDPKKIAQYQAKLAKIDAKIATFKRDWLAYTARLQEAQQQKGA